MTFYSALVLGLLANVHCAGMCGGLQMALQTANADDSLPSYQSALLLSVGRISVYLLLGAISFIAGFGLIQLFDQIQFTIALRLFAGIIVVLIGVQIMLRTLRPFAWLEGAAYRLRQLLLPIFAKRRNGRMRAFVNGVCWGFLPCGLLYGVVLTAGFSGALIDSLAIMLGFGLGTLPALLVTGSLHHRLHTFFKQHWLRTGVGGVYVIGGAFIISAPFWAAQSVSDQYPLLFNRFFCY